MYKVVYYTTARGDKPVRDFIRARSGKEHAKIRKQINLLRNLGPNLLRPHADVVEGKIRELRIKFGNSQIRILYAFFLGDRIVFLHALTKKTKEIPRRDIELAERRRKEIIELIEKGEIDYEEAETDDI